ncbi:mycofactocin biosynthesis chaperone MftB [Hoyosella sp. YIM 151337]|uniref:mycofactocin biosynthesis chaperone MftB n=1 Tax=Hoyosella sp. YIM 151337 TaxID=2992742 RepID=UPI002235D435|nr:mycofactocin biosynthesis chaperone MftB [Hoyosella sp. YIM 151337]MCW4353604.1 mycofactocin biosynthesis chaperone MftB [Hoyosella sp. YIM 151337]
MACVASTEQPAKFDPAGRYTLSPSVSVRPEPFGALLYDFHTRRLAFLKSPELATLVQTLHTHSSAQGAVAAAGVPAEEHGTYLRALAGLVATGTLTPKDT